MTKNGCKIWRDDTPPRHFPVWPPILSPGLPIYPDICVETSGPLIPDEVISRIEEIATHESDGSGLTDHLPEEAAQFFVDVVYEVRLHSRDTWPDCPFHCCSRLISKISPSRL